MERFGLSTSRYGEGRSGRTSRFPPVRTMVNRELRAAPNPSCEHQGHDKIQPKAQLRVG